MGRTLHCQRRATVNTVHRHLFYFSLFTNFPRLEIILESPKMIKIKVIQVGLFLVGFFGFQFVDSKLKVCSADRTPCQIPFVYKGQKYFECTTEAPGGEDDLFGRCPTLLKNERTREAGDNPDHWKK